MAKSKKEQEGMATNSAVHNKINMTAENDTEKNHVGKTYIENDNDSNNSEIICNVCSTNTVSFQCPLCQAEGSDVNGFYCSQSCFAKDWSAHRSCVHPTGRAKEKKRDKSNSFDSNNNINQNKNEIKSYDNKDNISNLNNNNTKNVKEKEEIEQHTNDKMSTRLEYEQQQQQHEQTHGNVMNDKVQSNVTRGNLNGGANKVSKAIKRSRDERDEDEVQNIICNHKLELPVWAPIPSAKVCAKINFAQITPPLSMECKRAVVIFDDTNKKLKNKSSVLEHARPSHKSLDNKSDDEQRSQEIKQYNSQDACQLVHDAMWPAITAIAHYIARYIEHVKEEHHFTTMTTITSTGNTTHRRDSHIVIVTGDASSAFAMAWGLRCAKVFQSTFPSLPSSLHSLTTSTSECNVEVKLNMRLNVESEDDKKQCPQGNTVTNVTCVEETATETSNNYEAKVNKTIENNENNINTHFIYITIATEQIVAKYSTEGTVSFLFDNVEYNHRLNTTLVETVKEKDDMSNIVVNESKLLITLPDVHEPMNLQGMSMSAIFVFAGRKEQNENAEHRIKAEELNACVTDLHNDYSSCLYDGVEIADMEKEESTAMPSSKKGNNKTKENSNKLNNSSHMPIIHTLTGFNTTKTSLNAETTATTTPPRNQVKSNKDKVAPVLNTVSPFTFTWCDLPLRITTIKCADFSNTSNNGNNSSDNNNNNNSNKSLSFARFHDVCATSIALGDIPLFLEQITSLYEQAPGKVEEVLYNTLCCDRAAVHANHSHHKLAYILRYCAQVTFARASTYSSRINRLDNGNHKNQQPSQHLTSFVSNGHHHHHNHHHRVSGSNANSHSDNSLFAIALRVILKLCKLLPPLFTVKTQNKSKGNAVSNNDNSADQSQTRADGNERRATVKEEEQLQLAALHVLAEPSAAEQQRYYNYYNPHQVNNLQLQATLAFIYPMVPSNVIDTLAHAWDVQFVIPSITNALVNLPEQRKAAAERIRLHYGSKFNLTYVQYLTALMLVLYDTVAIFGISEAALETRLLWNLSGMRNDVGNLRQFLSDCFLFQDDKAKHSNRTKGNNVAKKVTSLSSRLTSLKVKRASRSELTRALYPVRLTSVTEYKPIVFQPLPIAQHKRERQERQEKSAIEEILMVMPVDPRPMYIGEVGNRLGKWIHFNSKYNGTLGVSLSEFMSRHREHFKVVGTLVTRITRASNKTPIKIRYDNEEDNDNDVDNDNDNNTGEQASKKVKANDRALLTGQTGKRRATKNKSEEELLSKLPSRTRRKRAKKAANAARFNRNHKTFDQSAHVPGYVKHGPRKVKGRGKKPNKRLHKRS